jgi:hypothetical protein
MNCLLIETKDNRKLFTHKKNYPNLIEFGKTFEAEISVVKSTNAKVLELDELAPAICDPLYNSNCSFEILETKISKPKTKKISKAQKIRDFIRETFLENKPVELHNVAKKFKNQNLTLACFCNHISKVRKELTNEGYRIEKIGGGKYIIR